MYQTMLNCLTVFNPLHLFHLILTADVKGRGTVNSPIFKKFSNFKDEESDTKIIQAVSGRART